MTSPGARRLGPYEILSPLGAGGMGEVYRARDTRLSREVALKVLPASMSRDREFLLRFEQEARSLSTLTHPNIVTVFDVGRDGDTLYFAMELVEGESLRAVLQRGTLPLRRSVQIARDVAEGLAAAHEKGVVHRDLKPENVMVGSDGRVKLLDFGLAKHADALVASPDSPTLAFAKEATHPGMVLGTLGYMSPEQASGRPADHRSDQFSLGALLYEMVAGRRAFSRATGVETLAAIIRDEPEPITTFDPRTPLPLRWVIDQCLAKEPSERYASTRDLARDLRRVSEHLSSMSVSSASISMVGAAGELGEKAGERRSAWLPAAMLLVGLALGTAGAWWAWGRGASEPPSFRYVTSSGGESDPAVSPDGKTVAFASNRDGRSRIWLKSLEGGTEVALTEGPDRSPRFQADGASLIFVRDTASEPVLYRVPLLGGEARRVLTNVEQADSGKDGRLCFVRGIPGTDLVGVWTSISDGSAAKEIAREKGLLLRCPRWSPGGQEIALVSSPGGAAGTARQILVFSADGTKRRALPLAANVANVPTVAWSGRHRLVFGQEESFTFATAGKRGRVVLMDTRNGDLRTLFCSLHLGFGLDLVGDGRLVYGAERTTSSLAEVIPKEGGALRWITQGNAIDRQPAYSADGARILFSSDRDDNLDIWEVSRTTGAVRRLTDDRGSDWDPTLDREHLVWSSNRSGAFEIWRAAADGTAPVQVTNLKGDAENPTVTRDGQWIVFVSFANVDGKTEGIWKVRVDGREPTRLVADTPGAPPEVSPDGVTIAYVSPELNDSRVLFADLRDGKRLPMEIDIPFHDRQLTYVPGRMRWVDERRLAFLGQDESGRNGIFVQDVVPGRDTTDTRRTLAGFLPGLMVESFDVAEGGGRVVLSLRQDLSDLVLAENVAGIERTIR